MKTLLGIAAAGALGAVSRHLVGSLVQKITGDGFPWGTLAVNVAGSFLLGYLASLTIEQLPAHLRPVLMTGFMGAFTTYSTFSVDTARMLQEGRPGAAALNVLLQLALGLAAAGAGFKLAGGVD